MDAPRGHGSDDRLGMPLQVDPVIEQHENVTFRVICCERTIRDR